MGTTWAIVLSLFFTWSGHAIMRYWLTSMLDQLPYPISKRERRSKYTDKHNSHASLVVEGKERDMPIYQASFFSVITYNWFGEMMKKGNKDGLRVRRNQSYG